MFSPIAPPDAPRSWTPGMRRGGPLPLSTILPSALERLALAARGAGDGTEAEPPLVDAWPDRASRAA